jgi:uncharacterized protein with von Willebrand factor type A (vWA) domain
MFVSFYYRMREAGLPVRLPGFLALQRALRAGLVGASLARFYRVARALLIKNESYFDLYDRVFAAHFEGVELPEDEQLVDMLDRELLDWLADPLLTELTTPAERNQLPLEELLALFEQRLAEQQERHDGGSRWIGTGGRSPFGHSGHAPRGVRVGGRARHQSAVKVAGERRWRDYARGTVLKRAQLGEALRRLRQLRPAGARTELDVERSIQETVRQGGEIELVFVPRVIDRLRLIVLLDNGGWSMDPHVELVGELFGHLRAQIRDLQTYYFHNCIYETVYTDPARRQEIDTEDLLRLDRDWRLVIVGDAAMAPEELEARGGAIYRWNSTAPPAIAWLRALAGRFPRAVWINPLSEASWPRSRGAYTIARIRQIFPMVELTLAGIEQAVDFLNERTV